MKDTIFLMKKGTWVGMCDVPGMWILNDALKYKEKGKEKGMGEKKNKKKKKNSRKVIHFSVVIETLHKNVPHYIRDVHLLQAQSPLLPFYPFSSMLNPLLVYGPFYCFSPSPFTWHLFVAALHWLPLYATCVVLSFLMGKGVFLMYLNILAKTRCCFTTS